MAITSTALKNVGTEALKFAIVTPSGTVHTFTTSKSYDSRVQFVRHLDGAESKYVGLLTKDGTIRLSAKSAYPNITEEGVEKKHYLVHMLDKFLPLVLNDNHEVYEAHGFETRLLTEEEEKTTDTNEAQSFVSDLFLFAQGMQIKAPRIRVHYKDMRFKIDIKKGTGTIRLWSGDLVPGTHDPVGDQRYIGCFAHGQFLPANRWDTQGTFRYNRGTESNRRELLETEQEFLENLCERPSEFLAECGKDMGQCCYCGHQLEDPTSKALGYGAKCADNYGLPYGPTEYTEKQPSFSELYLSDETVRGLMTDLREDPRGDELARKGEDRDGIWSILRDRLQELGMTIVEKRKQELPTCPVRDAWLPRKS